VSDIKIKDSPGIKAYRLRAEELRRLANRPDPSSIRDALLVAASEWDALADLLVQRQNQPGEA
jgi:hypothetical protein